MAAPAGAQRPRRSGGAGGGVGSKNGEYSDLERCAETLPRKRKNRAVEPPRLVRAGVGEVLAAPMVESRASSKACLPARPRAQPHPFPGCSPACSFSPFARD